MLTVLKVVRTALQNAASIAGLMLTTETLVTDLDKDDKLENDIALEKGFRLLSAYTGNDGIKFYIITEASRAVTTVLLPEDY